MSRPLRTFRLKYTGLFWGGFFTLGSYLSIFTIVVPIIAVLPGAILESIASNCVDNYPYSNVGDTTILIHCILLGTGVLSFLIYTFLKSRKGLPLRTGPVVIFLSGAFFIAHSLGFYIYWKTQLNYRGDGQLIFAAFDSFKISSPFFIIMGLLTDVVWHTAVKTQNKNAV